MCSIAFVFTLHLSSSFKRNIERFTPHLYLTKFFHNKYIKASFLSAFSPFENNSSLCTVSALVKSPVKHSKCHTDTCYVLPEVFARASTVFSEVNCGLLV